MGDAVLLDRPDELLAGLGFDFPVNKHFQLIGEARSTMYMAASTPNAFNNNPVDALGGIKIFPARWWGFGLAYRRHMNQQDADISTPRLQHGGQQPVGSLCTWTRHSHRAGNYSGTTGGAPTGSSSRMIRMASSSSSGLDIAMHELRRRRQTSRRRLSVSTSSASITLPCPEGTSSTSCTASASRSVDLTRTLVIQDNDTLLYTWSVTGASYPARRARRLGSLGRSTGNLHGDGRRQRRQRAHR